MKVNLQILALLFIGTLKLVSQESACLPMLKDGLYKYVINKTTSSFDGDLKSYFESETFRDDIKSGKWNLGIDGVIPIGESGLMSEVGLDFGASEVEITVFQQKIIEAKSIQVNERFYQSSVTAVPDVGLAKAYADCVGKPEFGFILKDAIITPINVVFNISYRKRISYDPLPIVKDFKILGSRNVIQGLSINESVPDEMSISCYRYPENELIISINTDRENFVHVIKGEDIGFDKEFPVGTVLNSILDWNSFSQITEGKPSSEWDAGKSKWPPADGRSVSASKYARKSKKNELPDLRGVFIRGLNVFDPFYQEAVPNSQKDPDIRTAGSFQLDALQEHSHENGKGQSDKRAESQFDRYRFTDYMDHRA